MLILLQHFFIVSCSDSSRTFTGTKQFPVKKRGLLLSLFTTPVPPTRLLMDCFFRLYFSRLQN